MALTKTPIVCVECGKWLGDQVNRAGETVPPILLKFCTDVACNPPDEEPLKEELVARPKPIRHWS